MDYLRVSIRYDLMEEVLKTFQQRHSQPHATYAEVVRACFRSYLAHDETAEFKAAFKKGDWE